MLLYNQFFDRFLQIHNSFQIIKVHPVATLFTLVCGLHMIVTGTRFAMIEIF